MYRKKLSKFTFMFIVLSFALLVYVMPVFASGRIITDTITSPSLEGNLLGDPATRNMTIYLPPSYETSNNRYPVVYLLHGFGDNEKQYIGKKDDPVWLKYKELGLGDPPDFPDNGLDGMLDDLIAAGKITEMIIVTPNADNAYGGSWYNNSVLIGKYEDYITKDLVNYIDGKYRTIPNRNSRAIAGQSMGGYGAIKLAMRYPDVFGSVASHAGVLSLDMFKAAIPLIIAENPKGMTGPSADKVFTTGTYAMSAAFAPNLDKPPFFVDLCFEYPSPEVIKSVWDKFLQNDPVTMVPTHINNLASLNFIYMDAGDIDEYGANYQTQAYDEALNAFGIKHVYRTFAGGHRNKLFESLKISLSYFSDIFEQSIVVSIWQKTRVAANAHDWDEYGRYLADNVEFDIPPNPPTIGKEAVKQMQVESFKGSSDVDTKATLVLPTDNVVVVESLMSGTHDGVWAGIPATGKKYAVMLVDIFYFDGDKINKATEYMDYLPLVMQLGLILSPGPMELVPSFNLPNAVPNNLTSMDAAKELNKRWNSHDLSAYAEMINPDAKILVGAIGTPINRGAYIALQEGFFQSFPDVKGDTINLIDLGDGWTLTEQVFSGTQKGAYLGVPATGKSFMVRAGILSKFDKDGLLTNMSVYYDNMTILAQIKPTTEEINMATRKLAYTDLWNKGNLDIVDQIYSNDFAGSMTGYSGKDEVKMSVATTLKAYPDLQFTIDDIFASGDFVVTRITAIGTQKGEFMGVPPTNAKGEMTGISIARFDNGLIKQVWENNDELATAEHLGVIPPTRTSYGWGEPSKVTGDPGTLEANKALVLRDVEEFWNQKKVNEIDKIYGPDFISHNPYIPGNPASYAVSNQVALAYLSAFPDMHVTVEDIIASGDKVAIRCSTTGTNKGELMGIPATGRKMNWSGITIYRFADGKIVENWWAYDALGMIQQLTAKPPEGYDNIFFMSLSQGLNMISLPLKPVTPYTARSFAQEIGSTIVIRYNETSGKFEGFAMSAPGNGFSIEGGRGYIVNVPKSEVITFTGAAWTNEPPIEGAPPSQSRSAWAFMVSGLLLDGESIRVADGNYVMTVNNLQTGLVTTEIVNSNGGYFATAWADMNRKAVIKVGDKLEIAITDSNGKVVSGPFIREITLDSIRNALIDVKLKLGDIIPAKSILLQNYPNPFNPETWIPFYLKDASDVTVKIYGSNGQLVRTLELGHKDAGIYVSNSKAVYWNGKDESGERVSSGIYFYTIQAGKFTATKKLIIQK